MSDVSLALVGATGVVGKQLLEALDRRDFDADDLRLFAADDAEGEEFDYAGDVLTVEKCDDSMFRGNDVLILAVPPAIARPLALKAQQAGVWVVDCSGAFRLDEQVPLIAPGVNDDVLTRPFSGRIVSLASPPTQGLTAVLEPLRKKFGLLSVDATVLMGADSKGLAGVERLAKQTAELMNAKEPDVDTFAHRLAFNLVPGGGAFEKGYSEVERALLVEVVRVWAGAQLPIVATTAIYMPTYHGTFFTITAHLERPVDADGVRATFKAEAGLKVIDEPEAQVYPMPMLVTDDSTVHVGRIRALGERVQLVAAFDNAYRTADTAIDVALALAGRE